MKKLFTILFLFVSFIALSQNNGINFQGVGRNSSGAVLASTKISLRFSVIQSSETGTVEYVESKEVTTNAQGIFSVVIGDGTQISKTGNFSDINWKINPKFLKVEMDPAGGTSFVAMGTTRLQSVPFAYYANGVNADNVDGVLSASKGGTGVASISALKTALAIDQINNTSDLAKPISTATQAALDTKVNQVTGKELSSNDYTTAEKNKLAAITGINTGDQDLSGYATTTQLAIKANTTDVSTSLTGKVDKVAGKELSSNDYTTTEKNKLASITGTNTGDQDLSGFSTTTQLATKANTTDVTTSLAGKVDKVIGKELSTNDYTTTEKNKLAAITGTNTGDQDLSGFATTTQLATKANTTDVTTSLAGKVDKVTGKELSTNDYTTNEKNKLAAISGTNTGDQLNISGNAATATKLATPRSINGVPFDGSTDINISSSADASTLTGTTLNASVTASSLTSLGTLSSATINGKTIVGTVSATTSSAIFEINSTQKGFLPPRMTFAQRQSIASPVAGLIIYCTDCGNTEFTGEPQFYNGTSWSNMIGSPANSDLFLGKSYQGGKIFYILGPNDVGYDANVTHGLIASTTDQSTGIQWYNGQDMYTVATGTGIGSGSSNTSLIINAQSNTITDYAAGIARSYTGGGYTDWYLPSRDELEKLYDNKSYVGSFSSVEYWSSSEILFTQTWTNPGDAGAYFVDFRTVPLFLRTYYTGKGTNTYRVRAIKSF
jgi:hypothetical protein